MTHYLHNIRKNSSIVKGDRFRPNSEFHGYVPQVLRSFLSTVAPQVPGQFPVPGSTGQSWELLLRDSLRVIRTHSLPTLGRFWSNFDPQNFWSETLPVSVLSMF